MSEFMNSAELAFEAAHAANYTFDEMQRAETEGARNALTAEFVVLQTMAGVVLAPPADNDQRVVSEQERKAMFQKQLATPIDKLIKDLIANATLAPPEKKHTQELAFGVFDRENVRTFRDVLIIGRNDVSNMRNFGPKCMTFLKNTVSAVDPALEWPSRPTPEYIVKLCSGPEQVPARAVSPEFNSLFASLTRVYTLADLLELNRESMTQVLRQRYQGRSNEQIDSIARGLYNRAVAYARGLEAAGYGRKR